MKIPFVLFAAGLIFTSLIWNSVNTRETQGRTLRYESVDQDKLKTLKTLIRSQKTAAAATKVEVETVVEGQDAFEFESKKVFDFLKSNQVLYRYQLSQQLENLSKDLRAADVSSVEALNRTVNDVLDGAKVTVKNLKSFSPELKQEIGRRLDNLRSPLAIKKITKSVPNTESPKIAADQLSKTLDHLTRETEERFHGETVAVPFPWALMAALWAAVGISVGLLTRSPKAAVSTQDDQINPTLMRIMKDLDYPLFMVDQALNRVWENTESAALKLDLQGIQKIFENAGGESKEIRLNDKNFILSISELNYRSGKRHYLAQLRPKAVVARQTDHILDASEITSFLEGVSNEGDFGDFNETLASTAVRLNYLFKVSGKFVDLKLKKDISDCFIEKDRLETMVKEYLLACHHMVKDLPEVEGLYLRSEELGNKLVAGCFLMNFKKEQFERHPLIRDFLRRFSVLEARYSICQPVIDFRFIDENGLQGLDVTLNLENKSALESMMTSVPTEA